MSTTENSNQSQAYEQEKLSEVYVIYNAANKLRNQRFAYQNTQYSQISNQQLISSFYSEEITHVYVLVNSELKDKNNQNMQLNSIAAQHSLPDSKLENILVFCIDNKTDLQISKNSIPLKADVNNEQPIDINEISGFFNGNYFVGKISIKREGKKLFVCKVAYNKKVSSSVLKVMMLSDIIMQFKKANYVTVIDDLLYLGDNYNTRATKYLHNHPNCIAVFPHVSMEPSCSVSALYQFMNVFFTNYHQIESYAVENVMGVISHPRSFCFTTKKEKLSLLASSETRDGILHSYLSNSAGVYMNISTFSGISDPSYQYMYYDQSASAMKQYPDNFENFVSKESQYYSEHLVSFAAMYSLGLSFLKSKAPSALKVYYVCYLMLSIIPKIVDLLMPSLLLVLYYILFSYFFSSYANSMNGLIVSALIYLVAIIISMTQMVTRCSKWILLACVSVIGVLNIIMVGLYIKYTFQAQRAMAIIAFAILIVSYPMITGLGYRRLFIKRSSLQIIQYCIGLAVHAFTFEFHQLFIYMQSLLLKPAKEEPLNKEIAKKSNGVKAMYVTFIIIANFIVFCVFCTIDVNAQRGYIMLIEILSYYFVATSSLKVILVAVDLVRSIIVDKKKYIHANAKPYLQPETQVLNKQAENHIHENINKQDTGKMSVISKVSDMHKAKESKENSNTKQKSPKKENSQIIRHSILKEVNNLNPEIVVDSTVASIKKNTECPLLAHENGSMSTHLKENSKKDPTNVEPEISVENSTTVEIVKEVVKEELIKQKIGEST